MTFLEASVGEVACVVAAVAVVVSAVVFWWWHKAGVARCRACGKRMDGRGLCPCNSGDLAAGKE